MRIVKYKRTEFLMPWKISIKNPLYKFIPDIPYGLYFSVVPSLNVLNEILSKGSSGGGMGTGLIWEPFTIPTSEYDEVLEIWKSSNLRTVCNSKKIPDVDFIFDEEIMSISNHRDYYSKSSKKYTEKIFPKMRLKPSN